MKNSDMPAMPMWRTNSGGYWLKSDLGDGYVVSYFMKIVVV